MACAAPFIPEEVVQHRGLEELEAEITELWGYLNAATYRFLVLVAEFDRVRGYAHRGLANTAQWLNWQCGIGPVAAREKVRVARSLERLPEIADAFAKGEISYSKVRAMTRVATPANESVLVSIARHGTASHLEKLVKRFEWTQRRDAASTAQRQHEHRNTYCFYDMDGEFVLHARLPREIGAVVRKALDVAVEQVRESKEVTAETALQIPANAWTADALRLMCERFLEQRGEETGAGSSADRLQVVVHIDQAILAEQRTAAQDGEPHRCELEHGPALALDTARRLACDATVIGIVEGEDGEPLDIGRKTRSIPAAIARALRARDGGCRFPGCDRTRFCDGHHVKHWADGGETKLANLITLCGFHHRLVHEGGYGVRRTDDGAFVFTRPDGTRIEENGMKCFRGNSLPPIHSTYRGFEHSLRDYMKTRDPGLTITAQTSRCQWRGESMDYSQAIEAMQFLESKAAVPERLPAG
ncbi:MAG TPA: DUF222 domain-containing protein [Gammaproteobacteria bacterium]|nr:DUF222 domain-containing protein [Gammaproteobacteria bacterium]